MLAPLDNRALARPVEEAKSAGVPTVIIDSALESNSIVSFVATDNRKGGMLGADRLGELLGGKGKVIMLRYAEGSASTEEREAGFLQEMKQKYPNIEIISSDQHAGRLVTRPRPRLRICSTASAIIGVAKSFRNLPRVSVMPVNSAGVADVIGHASLIVTARALDGLDARVGEVSRTANEEAGE